MEWIDGLNSRFPKSRSSSYSWDGISLTMAAGAAFRDTTPSDFLQVAILFLSTNQLTSLNAYTFVKSSNPEGLQADGNVSGGVESEKPMVRMNQPPFATYLL